MVFNPERWTLNPVNLRYKPDTLISFKNRVLLRFSWCKLMRNSCMDHSVLKVAARSLRSLDRRWRTQTFASATCGGKTSSRCARPSAFLPERHAYFARASRPGKKGLSALCQRVSAANLCFYSNNMMNHLPAKTTNFFGDDPNRILLLTIF